MRSSQGSQIEIIVIPLTLTEDDSLALNTYVFVVLRIDLWCDSSLWFTISGHLDHQIRVILEEEQYYLELKYPILQTAS